MEYEVKFELGGVKTCKIFTKNESGNWYSSNWVNNIYSIILDEKDQKDIGRILSITDTDIRRILVDRFNRESNGLNIIDIVRIWRKIY